ncbi:hypothetical protein SKAU_G00113900 [Synaphobranchus kaupii]|uniref:Suppressor of cytokine signaling 3 n=1 Tax=Synaphobranchus kaupii TaxID=118154 RepID=A0A9Q1G1M5_SYNKA|nr:hypothetical protein SKAU_G00113900 [Synaphobranchus kaupii]
MFSTVCDREKRWIWRFNKGQGTRSTSEKTIIEISAGGRVSWADVLGQEGVPFPPPPPPSVRPSFRLVPRSRPGAGQTAVRVAGQQTNRHAAGRQTACWGDEPAGTFLVRDSSDSHHFFTISVKTAYGTKNLRVQCDSCSFFLPTDPESAQATAPRFDCVLKLVHHYMPPAAGRAPPCGSAENGASSRSTYFIYSGGEKIPLELLRPLCATMSSLQHLCRKTVNGHLDVCSKRDQLPHTLKEFLQEYDAPI